MRNYALKFEATYVLDICYPKYPKHMFYEDIRIKQGPSYISFCPLRILYNSKFILMATSLGTNVVVVRRVHYPVFTLDIWTDRHDQTVCHV